MTELNCEFSLFPSSFLAAYLVGAHPWDRGTQHLSSLLIVAARASPSWARQESDGKGATQNTIQTQRSRGPLLGWPQRPDLSCLQLPPAHPTFSSPQKESFRGPGCPHPHPPGRLPLHPKLCMHSPWPSVGRRGLRYLCSTSFPIPQHLVGAWSVTPLMWAFHVCGPR